MNDSLRLTTTTVDHVRETLTGSSWGSSSVTDLFLFVFAPLGYHLVFVPPDPEETRFLKLEHLLRNRSDVLLQNVKADQRLFDQFSTTSPFFFVEHGIVTRTPNVVKQSTYSFGFSWRVWLLIAVSIVGVSTFASFSNNFTGRLASGPRSSSRSPWSFAWAYFSVFLAQGTSSIPNGISQRLVLGFCQLSVVVLLLALGGNLNSKLTLGRQMFVNDFADILRNPKLKIIALNMSVPREMIENSAGNPTMMALSRRVAASGGYYDDYRLYEEKILTAFEENDVVLIDLMNMAVFLINAPFWYNVSFAKRSFYVGSRKFVSSPVSYVIRKHAPKEIAERINVKLCRYVETSQNTIHDRHFERLDLYSSASSDAYAINDQYDAFTVSNLEMGFVILVEGLALAILVCIGELFLASWLA